MTDKYKRRPSGAAVVLECRVHLALQSVGPFITKFTLVKLLLLLCSHNLPFTLLLEQQLGGASDVHTNVQALSYHGRWFNNVIKHVWVCVLHLYIATHPLLKGGLPILRRIYRQAYISISMKENVIISK